MPWMVCGDQRHRQLTGMKAVRAALDRTLPGQDFAQSRARRTSNIRLLSGVGETAIIDQRQMEWNILKKSSLKNVGTGARRAISSGVSRSLEYILQRIPCSALCSSA